MKIVMKTMKNEFLLKFKSNAMLLLTIAGISCASCSDWLEKDQVPFYSRYAIVSKQDAKITFLTDGGATLFTDSRSAAVTGLENNQRVIVDFMVKEELDDAEYKIGLYSIYKVLTKDALVLSAAISDSLGLDPVSVNRAWIRHGYLNIDFNFIGGEPGLKHMVNLAVDTTTLPRDADCIVEFRHNAFKDPYARYCRGVVAFPLATVLPRVKSPGARPDEVTLRLKVKYYGTGGSEHFIPLDWKITPGKAVSSGEDEVAPAEDSGNQAETVLIQ
jgi:hypothetical protein